MLFQQTIATETYAAIRFGTGFPTQGGPTDADGIISALSEPDTALAAYPLVPFETTLENWRAFVAARQARQKTGDNAQLAAARKTVAASFASALVGDLSRWVSTDDPFRERLHRFWSDHFTTRAKSGAVRGGQSGFAADAIRPHIKGRFADLLKAAVTHPFMLIYLDQRDSIGPNSPIGQSRGRGLNENLAREVLELHSLGVNSVYNQEDVTQFAELLTGLHADRTNGFRFLANRAEPGAEMVLGQRYGGRGPAKLTDIHQALDDIAAHPSTARHIATKLASHFVADQPDPDLVRHIEAAFARSGGDLMATYQAMLEHPASWRDFGAKVKQPFELIASSMRAVGIRAEDLAELPVGRVRKHIFAPLRRMGQEYAAPPGPDGWPDTAEAWINPHGIAGRIGWARALAHRLPKNRVPDPRAFLSDALGDAASAQLVFAAGAAESRVQGVTLILASAEFNRR